MLLYDVDKIDDKDNAVNSIHIEPKYEKLLLYAYHDKSVVFSYLEMVFDKEQKMLIN